jgi:hypothetical protein
VAVESPFGGVVDGGEQYGVFGGEPAEGSLVVVDGFRDDPVARRAQRERVAAGVQQPGSGIGGVQIVVEDPPRRVVAPLGGIEALGQIGGVGPQDAR